VEPSREVRIGGKICHLSDLIVEVSQAFSFKEEIEWRTVTLALYRSQVSSWQTRFGEQISFERITRELLRRARSFGQEELTCAGTHTFYALALLYRVNEQQSLWRPAMREEVEQILQASCKRLERTQLKDGSWDDNWQLPGLARNGWPTTRIDRLRITGHNLEWIALLPKTLRMSNYTIERAGDFVLSTIRDMTIEEVQRYICPCSHGIRAYLLSETL
jgi:hypothetical protein